MAMLETGQTAGQRICKALGVDPGNVTEVVVRYAPDEIVTATVVMAARSDITDKVVRDMSGAMVKVVDLDGQDIK